MRLFFAIIISFFILTACSSQPQATVTSAKRVTVTLLPPTATVIPTPELNPEFLALQEQVAGDTQNYSIMGNGDIEGKLPDGTIGVINGITLNPDGTSYTITVNGAEITIDADKVTITDQKGVQIEGYENLDGDENYEKVVKFDASVWDSMDQPARDSVKDALPVTISFADAVTNETVELMRGGFSTVKDNLVKFYDGGLLVQVYDFENGKYMTPEQAGIIEFLLTDNTTWEIPYFGKDQAQEAVNFMANDGAMGAYVDFGKSTEISTYALTRFNKLINFNRQFYGGGTVQYDGDPKGGAAFAVSIADYGAQNTFLTYMTPDFKFNTIMLNVSAKAAAGMMSLKQVTAPDPL